jgi:hypothetical protein
MEMLMKEGHELVIDVYVAFWVNVVWKVYMARKGIGKRDGGVL